MEIRRKGAIPLQMTELFEEITSKGSRKQTQGKLLLTCDEL
jgi:hypothetical protein